MLDENVFFLDTETTSLHPETGEIWNVGIIYPTLEVRANKPTTVEWIEYEWFLPVNLGQADPMSLGMNHFKERYPSDGGKITSLPIFAMHFMRMTWGLHPVGAIPLFDCERLWRLLNRQNKIAMWHYHLIDVEALAIGFLRGKGITKIAANPEWIDNGDPPQTVELKPPWKSKALSLALGVDPAQFEQHTALGDAKWAKAVYEAVIN